MITPWRRHRWDDRELPVSRVGEVVVVGEQEARLTELALALPRQHGTTIVLVSDGTDDGPRLWHALKRVMKRKGTHRLVLSNAGRGGTRSSAQWLAEQVGGEVIAPDGVLSPMVDGDTFVTGAGHWWRFRPGDEPVRLGTRFPVPDWEQQLPHPLSGVDSSIRVDPVPAGIWVRAATSGTPPSRKDSACRLRPQQDVVLVVVGEEGEAEPSVEAVCSVLRTLPAAVVPLVRLVTTASRSVEVPFAQRVADALGWAVIAVNDHGVRNWRPFVTAVCHLPGRPAPVIARWWHPRTDLVQLRDGVYRLAEDVVAEVIQSGVWIREDRDHADADAVRSAPPEPSWMRLFVGSEDTPLSPSLRTAAEEFLAGLDSRARLAARTEHRTRREAEPASVVVPAEGDSTVSGGEALTEVPAVDEVVESRTAVVDEFRSAGVGTETVPSDHHSTEAEREWLRRTLGARFDLYANAVRRVLTCRPGLCADDGDLAAAVIDLVAVKVYLEATEQKADAALREGRLGELRPYLHCVVSGLRRLPAQRGAVWVGVPDAGTIAHRKGTLLVERGLLNAFTESAIPAPGGDFVIWSTTARRLCGLDVEAGPGGERVVFPPQSTFKVIGCDAGGGTTFLRDLGQGGVEGQALTERDNVLAERLRDVAARRGDAGSYAKDRTRFCRAIGT